MDLERTQVLAQGAEDMHSEKINQVVDSQVFLYASWPCDWNQRRAAF